MTTYKPDLKYADFGTMGKTAFKAKTLSTFMRSKQKTGMSEAELPDPRRQTTEQFYLTHGKRIKAPTAQINKRTSYLEADKWTDNVFTGDTANFQADLTTKVKKRVTKLGIGQIGKPRIGGREDLTFAKTEREGSRTADLDRTHPHRHVGSVKPTTFSKIDVHAAADQETQLVRLDHRKTLEGKVDLKKVRDIRRAIRRRYATRKNPSKLFHAWDLKQQKKIDTEDVVNMVNKLGIKINKDEAYVLLKSADINGDNALDVEEFIGLIHSTNEALDVDLKDLAPLSDEMMKSGKRGSEVVDKLQQKASNQYENKLDNQMRLFIQKSSQTIGRDCLNEDAEVDGQKTYQIDKKKLKAILKHRLKLPEILKNDQARIDKIIDEYTTDNKEFVDYKSMLDDLRMFDYNIESNSVKVPFDRKEGSTHASSEYSEPQDSGRASLTILDIQKVPYNKEEDIKKRSSKLNRMLKQKFKTQQALTSHLKDKIDVDKNGIINLNEFKSLIINTFKDEIENSTVDKKDIEGFLSNFVYNKYGYTAVEEVAPRVFATVEDYNRIIDHFRKPKPPPSLVNNGLVELGEENVKDKFYIQRVKALADKIVDKALGSTNSKYQCFKSFDVDDDGYISYQDFANKVKQMEIPASANEIMSVVKSIDTSKNGYIDFREFMKYFTPNLPEITNDQLPYFRSKHLIGSVNGNLVPNKDLLMNQINRSKSTNSKLMSVTNSFKASADIHMNLKPSTRFSATPQWKNTFTHFHMDPKSSGYISEDERFRKTSNSLHIKNQFQHEDKARRTQVNDNRVNRKRNVFGAVDEKAYNNDVYHDAFDQGKLNHKAAIVQNYERLCHSRVI